jgi:hypothetical protein
VELTALLDKLAVHPDDAAPIVAGWPPPRTPELDAMVARIRADLGGHAWLDPGPGPHFVSAFLTLVATARDYHRAHGIPDEISWATLADFGRNLAVDRRMRGEGWEVMRAWLTLHLRGGLFELGRLQYQRGGDGALSLHVPEAGPLTPASVDASLERARAFFPRHFPDERYTTFSCGSWLLDPQLREYLPADSHIIRFQDRFTLSPYERPEDLDPDVEVLRFVFRTLTTPLCRLPRDTRLRRAVLAHLESGRHWHWRHGTFPIQPAASS